MGAAGEGSLAARFTPGFGGGAGGAKTGAAHAESKSPTALS